MLELIWFLIGSTITLSVVLVVVRLRQRRNDLRRAAEDVGNHEDVEEEPQPEAHKLVLADNRSLETLARGVGLELASLASSIEGHGQLLCERHSGTSSVTEQAERLWESVRRLRFFSEKMQAFCRVEAISVRPTRITPLLQGLVHEIDDYAGGSLEVRLNTAPSLPMALADAQSLRSALLFLVESVLTLDTGTPSLTLAAQTELNEDMDGEVVIEIQAESEDLDEGRNEEPSQDRDSRDADIRISYGAARNLLEAQGAWVSLTHRPGASVVASVSLKATTSLRAPQPPQSPEAQPEAVTAGSQEAHQFGGILVLDRNPGIREMLTHELRRLGRNVIACDEGKAAQSLYSATPERFELLILEQNARRMSGEELAAKALADRPDVRVILLTSAPHRHLAGAESAPDPRCRRIPKPFGLMELRSVVGELLGSGPTAAPAPGEVSGKTVT